MTSPLPPETAAHTYAWLFLSVGEEPRSLHEVIAMADVINVAIPSHRELQVSLGWLRARGLVRKEQGAYSLTPAGVALRSECQDRSPAKTWDLIAARFEPDVHRAEPEDEVTSEEIERAYRRYHKAFWAEHRKPGK